jgi:hypothetical protein
MKMKSGYTIALGYEKKCAELRREASKSLMHASFSMRL